MRVAVFSSMNPRLKPPRRSCLSACSTLTCSLEAGSASQMPSMTSWTSASSPISSSNDFASSASNASSTSFCAVLKAKHHPLVERLPPILPYVLWHLGSCRGQACCTQQSPHRRRISRYTRPALRAAAACNTHGIEHLQRVQSLSYFSPQIAPVTWRTLDSESAPDLLVRHDPLDLSS